MSVSPQLLLVGAVLAVGVLHSIVPDHWVPISLIARQRGWSRRETALAAVQAGTGHVVTTLIIASVVWVAGAAVATRFGHYVDLVASLALIGFGGWIGLSALRDLRGGQGHGHSHAHGHSHSHGHAHAAPVHAASEAGIHGPELERIATGHGEVLLSIYETGAPPRFRLTGTDAELVLVETERPEGERQRFEMADHGAYWESVEEIPEPHGFAVRVTLGHHDHEHVYEAHFAEHEHGDHDHHDHDHAAKGDRTSGRTALLLILGSSPMVEGIPAFFAAGKYGPGLLAVMSVVFALSTIATYVVLCVLSTAGLQRVRLGAFERYGEVLSGGFIVVVGAVFLIWPAL